MTETTYQEGIKIVTVYTSKNIASNYIRQNTITGKGKNLYSDSKNFKHFYQTELDTSSRQKISKAILNLKNKFLNHDIVQKFPKILMWPL